MVLLTSAGDDDIVHIREYISADLPLQHRFGKPRESGPGVLESLRHSDEAIRVEGCCWRLVLKCYELRTRQHRKCQSVKSFVLRSIISLRI
jgi:hypothetical protein